MQTVCPTCQWLPWKHLEINHLTSWVEWGHYLATFERTLMGQPLVPLVLYVPQSTSYLMTQHFSFNIGKSHFPAGNTRHWALKKSSNQWYVCNTLTCIFISLKSLPCSKQTGRCELKRIYMFYIILHYIIFLYYFTFLFYVNIHFNYIFIHTHIN